MPEKTCLYRKRSVSESLSFIIDRLEDNRGYANYGVYHFRSDQVMSEIEK